MSNENNRTKEQLKLLLDQAVQQESGLREQYQMGDKFRFIRDRLHALRSHVEQGLASLQKKSKETKIELATDEMPVYVYLYNAQGLVLQTWTKMLKPSVFYEYSVNRPIYQEKSQVESFIRGKHNKSQHGYLTIAVKKADVFAGDNEATKDTVGHQLIKVREGSLQAEKVIAFNHLGNEYVLNEEGKLVSKKK